MRLRVSSWAWLRSVGSIGTARCARVFPRCPGTPLTPAPRTHPPAELHETGGETVTGGFVTVEADTAAAIGSGVVLSAAIKIARQGLTDAKPQSDAGLLHRVTRHGPIPCFVP